MIDIKVYMVMGQCCLEIHLSEGNGRTVEAVRSYFDLRESSPLEDLSSQITKALDAADAYAGEVRSELLFGT